jgi:hypothetical protein
LGGLGGGGDIGDLGGLGGEKKNESTRRVHREYKVELVLPYYFLVSTLSSAS